MPTFTPTLGHIIALGVIVVALVLAVMGTLPWLVAGLFIALGVSRFT